MNIFEAERKKESVPWRQTFQIMNSDTKTIKIYDGVTLLLDNNISGN